MIINQEFNNAANDNSHISLDDAAKLNWANSFPDYSPEELYEEITKDIPEYLLKDTTLRVKFEDDLQWDSILIQNQVKDSSFSFQYFNEPGRTVNLIHADVDEELQGRNISKTVQRNMFEILKETGTKTIEVSATSVGNYVWAKMGFVPEQGEWDDLRSNIFRRYRTLIDMCSDNNQAIDANIANNINEALSDNDPKSIWKIADMNSPCHACDKINWGQALLLPEQYMPEELKEHIKDRSDISFTFNGSIDLFDRDNMEKVCAYLYRDDEYPLLMEGTENNNRAPTLIYQ